MRLTKARVLNFKCALDSNWFTVGELTCLVGKNESGKTAVLEGLEKLNSVRSERGNFADTEYPRINWSEYEESGNVDVGIETEWLLDDEEVKFINGLLGVDVLTSRTIELSKDYKNKLNWDIRLDYQKAVDVLLESSGLTSEEKENFGSVENTTGLLAALEGIGERTPRQEAFLAEFRTKLPQGGLRATVEGYLRGRLPGFVYYSQYDRLPGRVSVDQLLAAQSNDTLDQIPGSRIFLALLSMVGTNPEAIKSITRSEELISKLEAVESRLSKRIFKYWSQNKHLKVRFRYDAASPGDPAPYNSGMIFQTRIENTRHSATIRLDERSTGFIWFFSFLVWFSEVQKQHGHDLIVLLDEPGLTLHARAQADLLRYVREELLPKYQVIYTTHSPFMIDPADLLSCRTVEDATGPNDEVEGTKVGDQILSTDTDTLFPLQAALGYDITQTLFVGKHTLLVEGPSDLLYLNWASAGLIGQKRTGFERRWTITPCGGITKVSSFMALFGGSGVDVAVLTDYGRGDKAKVRELRQSQLLKDGRVFTAEMYVDNSAEADVEDILGRELYIHLVNVAYGLNSKNSLPIKRPQGAPERVVVEVEEHFRKLPANVPEYDHYAPARYLIEHSSELSLPGTEDALDRFEKLFTDLNKILG
jgi:predicted ATPase